MRHHSLALDAATLAAAGVHAQVAAGGVSVWNDPTRTDPQRHPAQADPLGPQRALVAAALLDAAAAKRARRAARNLRNARRGA
jgi:hypothetical protein